MVAAAAEVASVSTAAFAAAAAPVATATVVMTGGNSMRREKSHVGMVAVFMLTVYSNCFPLLEAPARVEDAVG